MAQRGCEPVSSTRASQAGRSTGPSMTQPPNGAQVSPPQRSRRKIRLPGSPPCATETRPSPLGWVPSALSLFPHPDSRSANDNVDIPVIRMVTSMAANELTDAVLRRTRRSHLLSHGGYRRTLPTTLGLQDGYAPFASSLLTRALLTSTTARSLQSR